MWRTEGLGGFALSDGAEAELPDRLHGVWIDHLGHLLRRHPAETVQTLEVAAVLGQEVDLAEWHHVCQAAHLQIPENLLQELLSARLALNSPRGWRFAHGMLRESLLRQARESGRLVHHHQIAVRALRAWVRTAVDLERLGQFSIEGGDPFGALDLLSQAPPQLPGSVRSSRRRTHSGRPS